MRTTCIPTHSVKGPGYTMIAHSIVRFAGSVWTGVSGTADRARSAATVSACLVGVVVESRTPTIV